MDFQIDLDAFRGPLDLLLFLVKRDEVDVLDIPIARITDQFLSYLKLLEQIDVEWAGDFVVMAATLTEIKSRLALPRAEGPEAEAEDPRRELVKQLLEYKKFKDAAAALEAQAEQRLLRVPRLPVPPPAGTVAAPQPLRKVELWDLVSAFGRLMRETLALQPKQIVMDETPQDLVMESVLERFSSRPRLSLAELFAPPRTRGRLLGLFLAILELMKSKKIEVEQEAIFGQVWVALKPEE